MKLKIMGKKKPKKVKKSIRIIKKSKEKAMNQEKNQGMIFCRYQN